MQIVNQTPFVAGWTQGFGPDCRERVVVAVRATYRLESAGEPEPLLAETQAPLLEADVFGDDPAFDAPRFENDFALFKPRCDVLLRGCAHAPNGVPAPTIEVALRVGACQKAFRVTGPRVWSRTLMDGARASPPVPFIDQEISYDVAFGGTDIHPTDPSKIRSYLPNPCGSGYCQFSANLDQMALAVTEAIDDPITRPDGNYSPMAFGPLGRHWVPRLGYAGTYDQRWRENKLPFLPDDFDWQYFQAAPLDQQIPYPSGGESIVLLNLGASGPIVTRVPERGVTVVFVRHRGEALTRPANLDTLLLEPELDRMTLVWRATCPMKRDVFELREMVVLDSDPAILARDRARRAGKTHYENLDDAVRGRKQGKR